MNRAGFILVGGKSSRMGRDKALLPYRGTVLVSWIAREVETVTGTVTLVGAPDRYASLGRHVIADSRAGCGPLAGIEAALRYSSADWNVIVACDMPGVTAALLENLLIQAAEQDCDCLLPVGATDFPEPLCAVWHVRCLAAIRSALNSNVRKITDALGSLRVVHAPSTGLGWAVNVNTPADWQLHLMAVSE